ncbi:hypothetical protein Tco_1448806 [Tanacetum coccineum]
MEFITLTIDSNAVQIFKIPYNGQAVFTNDWDLGSLQYSQETEGPYFTDLPTPDDIRRLLELECVMNSFSCECVWTRRTSDHLPACLAHMLYCVVAEEQYNLAYLFVKRIECARANPIANLPYGMFLTRLFRKFMEVYPHYDYGNFMTLLIESMVSSLALKQTRRPRSDRGKARHSVSSSFFITINGIIFIT